MRAPEPSRAEITMKSGAVVTFGCTKLSWRRDALGDSLKWVTPDSAKQCLVHIDIDEIAAVVFVDGTR